MHSNRGNMCTPGAGMCRSRGSGTARGSAAQPARQLAKLCAVTRGRARYQLRIAPCCPDLRVESWCCRQVCSKTFIWNAPCCPLQDNPQIKEAGSTALVRPPSLSSPAWPAAPAGAPLLCRGLPQLCPSSLSLHPPPRSVEMCPHVTPLHAPFTPPHPQNTRTPMPHTPRTPFPAYTRQEELQQHRKTLRVCLGASPPPPPPKQPPSGSLRPGKQAGQQPQQQPQGQQGDGGGGQPPCQQQQNGGSSGGSLADSVKNNPVISKYFAVSGFKVVCGDLFPSTLR